MLFYTKEQLLMHVCKKKRQHKQYFYKPFVGTSARDQGKFT